MKYFKGERVWMYHVRRKPHKFAVILTADFEEGSDIIYAIHDDKPVKGMRRGWEKGDSADSCNGLGNILNVIPPTTNPLT